MGKCRSHMQTIYQLGTSCQTFNCRVFRPMGDTPSDGSNRPIGRSVPPGAMPAQPRPSAQRAHERRRALIVSCGMLLVAALAAVVVIAAESTTSRHASNPPPAAPAMPGSDLRTGKITRQSDGDG
jgi:hypothetical protein